MESDRRLTAIQRAFEADSYAAAQGFHLDGVSRDDVVVSMTVASNHLNFHGTTHGGVVFSLADCAFSLASNAHGAAAVAIDMHLALTAASRLGDSLIARAVEMTRSRALATYRVDVVRGDGRVIALFTGTVFIQSPD